MLKYDRYSGGQHLIRILQWTGHFLWHRNNQALILYRIYRVLLHTALSFPFTVAIALGAIFSQVGDTLYMSCIMVAMTVKILSIWRNDTTAFDYIDELVNSAELGLQSPAEVQHWEHEAKFFKRITWFYLSLCIIVVLTALINVLLLNTYEMPFDFWTPFDYRNPHYYWYAYAFQFFGMFLSCVSNGTLDMSCCYFLFHLAQLYKVLGMRFETMQMEESADGKVVDELRRLFHMHSLLKRLTTKCDLLVGTSILAQIILSSFILCFLGYRLTLISMSENLAQVLVILQMITIMTVQIFLPCYYANEVTYHSDGLTAKVYSSNWLNWSASTQKLIYNYMESLKRPAIIKAGSFFLVGLPIFGKTINNAYSLFAVLLNMGK